MLKSYLSTAESASKAHAGYKRLIWGQREEIYPAAQCLNSSHVIRSLGLLVVIYKDTYMRNSSFEAKTVGQRSSSVKNKSFPFNLMH